MSARGIWLLFGATALSLAGCGAPSAEEICEDINDDCPETVLYDECASEGERLTDLAEERGCEERMDAYLECLDEELCAWRAACDAKWQDLTACVGEIK